MKLTFVEETLDERNGLLFWLQGDGWFVRRVDGDEYTLHSPATVARVKQHLDALEAELAPLDNEDQRQNGIGSMSSTFTARKEYKCNQCHRENEAQMHVYAKTHEILVFGHICCHCQAPSEEVSALLRSLKEDEESLTFHYAQLNSAWCMHCDTATSVELDAMHAHMRDVHPPIWATN